MRSLRNLWSAPALLAAVLAAGFAAAAADRPTAAEVARIESVVDLPSGARSLNEYDRFYARSTEEGRPVILGAYQRTWIRDVAERHRRDDPANWKMAAPQRVGEVYRVREADLPVATGGGCTVINLVYDVERQAVARVSCHGAA